VPFGIEVDRVADDLEQAGCAYLSVKRYLSLIASRSRHALQSCCFQIKAIDGALVECFLHRPSRSPSTATTPRSALGHMLRQLGRDVRAVRLSASERRDAEFLTRFDTSLRDVRGLEAKSREELLRAARRTLDWYRQTKPRQPDADSLTWIGTKISRGGCGLASWSVQ